MVLHRCRAWKRNWYEIWHSAGVLRCCGSTVYAGLVKYKSWLSRRRNVFGHGEAFKFVKISGADSQGGFRDFAMAPKGTAASIINVKCKVVFIARKMGNLLMEDGIELFTRPGAFQGDNRNFFDKTSIRRVLGIEMLPRLSIIIVSLLLLCHFCYNIAIVYRTLCISFYFRKNRRFFVYFWANGFWRISRRRFFCARRLWRACPRIRTNSIRSMAGDNNRNRSNYRSM